MQGRYYNASSARCPPTDYLVPQLRKIHACTPLSILTASAERTRSGSTKKRLRGEILTTRSSRHVPLLCTPWQCCLWCGRDFSNRHDIYLLESIRRTDIFGLSALLSLIFTLRLLERALPRVASRQYMLHSRRSTSVHDRF
jgi:hypothetical protein